MKIKHIVEAEKAEVDLLFDMVMTTCMTTYPNVDEQAIALANCKVSFEKALNEHLGKAFKLGKKLGKMKADSKDDTMYQGEMGTEIPIV